jgi:predicted  nucleic acid-binding Zn-ribbon protein
VSNLDERVALLEGRVQEQAAHMTDLRAMGAEFRQELRDLRQELRQSIGEVRQELGQLREEMRQFRAEMDRRFTWLVGMMVTGFLAVIGTVAGAFWGLLRTLN